MKVPDVALDYSILFSLFNKTLQNSFAVQIKKTVFKLVQQIGNILVL